MSEINDADALDSKKRRPGRGRRRARPFGRGRQVAPDAVAEIRALIGPEPLARDMLIEYLHRIQDTYGHLSAAHLAALADEMRLAQAEVYEVATFYAHFDVVKEGEAAPPPITVRVCDSLTCAMMGAEDLLAELAARAGREFRVVRAPCMGRCDAAPAVAVGHRHVEHAAADQVLAAVRERQASPEIPDYLALDGYRAQGGYDLLDACRAGAQPIDDIIAALDQAGLRGLGGAGFPAARKWAFVRAEPAPRYLVVNADEGEPGTFKDRFYLESDPHRVLEGALIAAWAIEADAVYIYLRDEYPAIRQILADEIAGLEAAGLTEAGYIRLRRGAGAYICGEESAMLESIEGKRGLPRHKPPFPAQVGLFGRPTLIHNVETLYWIRDIVSRGADWFAGQGRHGRTGLRSFSVSGRVRAPGVKLAPAGITLRELIDEYCGGMAEGHALRAYLPGGASGGILPATMADLPLDFGTLEEHGCFIGSAAVIVLSDQDNLADAVRNLLRFFEDESCGQCTPCRVGTEKAVMLMMNDSWDREVLEDLVTVMSEASICGLGQAAGNPIRSLLTYFPDDLPGKKQVTS